MLVANVVVQWTVFVDVSCAVLVCIVCSVSGQWVVFCVMLVLSVCSVSGQWVVFCVMLVWSVCSVSGQC